MCASEFLLCIHLCTTKSKGHRVDSSIIREFFFPRALILTLNQRNQGNDSNRFLDSFLCILRGVFPECGLRCFKSCFKAFITEFSVVCYFNLLSEIFICKHWGFLFLISPVSFSLLLCLSIPIWKQVNKGERESVTFSGSHHYWCVLSAKWSTRVSSLHFHPVMFSHSSTKATVLNGHLLIRKMQSFPCRAILWLSTAFWIKSELLPLPWRPGRIAPWPFHQPHLWCDPTGFLSVLQMPALSSLRDLIKHKCAVHSL